MRNTVGLLSAPLRDRFGIIERFEFYTPEELSHIISRSADLLEVGIDGSSSLTIANSSRGTPRISNRILKRVRDWAQVHSDGTITDSDVQASLDALGIDSSGIDQNDRSYLESLIQNFQGPVGVDI